MAGAGLRRPEWPRRRVEVALVRTASGGARKRIRVNGVARRAAALVGALRTVLFAPEEMLLVIGSPSLRRESLDRLAGQRSPAYLPRPRDLRPGAPAAQRAAAADPRGAGEPRRAPLLGRDVPRGGRRGRGGAAAAARRPGGAAGRAPTREIAPEEAAAGRLRPALRDQRPAASRASRPRDALARRLAETAEKEVWNGTTLVGPHRDDLTFELDERPLASFASRGQQRTAILAFKLAELDLLTALDGRPPLLLLDDVFSRAGPGAARPPGPPDRGAAAGVRDHHHPRRPRPGAALDRHRLGGDDGRRRTARLRADGG